MVWLTKGCKVVCCVPFAASERMSPAQRRAYAVPAGRIRYSVYSARERGAERSRRSARVFPSDGPGDRRVVSHIRYSCIIVARFHTHAMYLACVFNCPHIHMPMDADILMDAGYRRPVPKARAVRGRAVAARGDPPTLTSAAARSFR